jgi:glycosyltransferase involved in cell wall biosynthesis
VVLFTHVNAARLGRARRVPYVVVAHGEEVWTRLPAPQRLALRRAAAVISVSAHTKGRLCEAQGVAPEKVVVVPLALEPSSMPAAAPLPDGPLRLLSVARLEQGFEDKGVDDVIRAMPAVLRELPEVTYSVVGAGSDVPRLRELARSSGVEAAVDFAGALDHQALLDAYRACTAFVLPSRREGFGLVFLEAMAVGRPVIAADAGGAPEVVIDGETGVLVDDTALLADAIVSLLRDPARCHSFGQAGRARVERELSFERFAEETERVLRGV